MVSIASTTTNTVATETRTRNSNISGMLCLIPDGAMSARMKHFPTTRAFHCAASWRQRCEFAFARSSCWCKNVSGSWIIHRYILNRLAVPKDARKTILNDIGNVCCADDRHSIL